MTFDRSPPTRRSVLAGLGAVTAGLSVSATSGPSAQNQVTVRGRVLAAHPQATAGPAHTPGIPNVLVSNGVEVSCTDNYGTWMLPAQPGAHIFMIKPAQWSYLQDAGIPSFSYCVGYAADQRHDFHLTPSHEADAFDVVLFADTQAANATELEYVRRELASCLSGTSAAFAISHGDVMGDNLELLRPYRDIVAKTGLIWHHCPGNHDIDFAARSSDRAFDTWQREIGPTTYAFQYGRATFIVLNNVEYFGADATPVDGRRYRGRIGADQLTFVRNILQRTPADHLVVVSMHIPLVSFDDPNAPGDNTSDRAELLELLSRFPHTVSFSGHSHTTEHHYLGAADGFLRDQPHHHHVLTAFCGSWWSGPLNHNGIPVSDSRDGSPRGFHVLSVRGNDYQTRFVAVGDNVASDVRLSVSTQAAETHTAHARLTVNCFDGGPKTRVRCVLPGGSSPVELNRITMQDPHIVAAYQQHRDLLKPWVGATPSSHIWAGTVPLHNGATYTLDIVNEYGNRNSLAVTI